MSDKAYSRPQGEPDLLNIELDEDGVAHATGRTPDPKPHLIADAKYEVEVTHAEFLAAKLVYEQKRKARDLAIKHARWAGVKPSDIARICGLSRARIAQLK